MQPSDSVRTAYHSAWNEWLAQVEHLHRVLLEGESIRPEQMKGLLNREARRKEAYDAARLRLLGIEPAAEPLGDPNANPFKSGSE